MLKLTLFVGDNWNKINNQVDKAQFTELLLAFSNINAELQSKYKKETIFADLEKLYKVGFFSLNLFSLSVSCVTSIRQEN